MEPVYAAGWPGATGSLQIGHMNDETAEVLSGLSQGDVVILHPSDTLADGNLVEAR